MNIPHRVTLLLMATLLAGATIVSAADVKPAPKPAPWHVPNAVFRRNGRGPPARTRANDENVAGQQYRDLFLGKCQCLLQNAP